MEYLNEHFLKLKHSTHFHKHPHHVWEWLVVAATFFIRITVSSLKVSFGVVYLDLIQHRIVNHLGASIIIAVFVGSNCFSNLVATRMPLRDSLRKLIFKGILSVSAGLALCTVSFYLPYMVLCYGALGGVGSSLANTNTFIITQSYLRRRRTAANVLASLGSSLSLVVMPLFVHYMIGYLSLQGTFLVWSALVMQGLVGAMFYRVPRCYKRPSGEQLGVKSSLMPKEMVDPYRECETKFCELRCENKLDSKSISRGNKYSQNHRRDASVRHSECGCRTTQIDSLTSDVDSSTPVMDDDSSYKSCYSFLLTNDIDTSNNHESNVDCRRDKSLNSRRTCNCVLGTIRTCECVLNTRKTCDCVLNTRRTCDCVLNTRRTCECVSSTRKTCDCVHKCCVHKNSHRRRKSRSKSVSSTERRKTRRKDSENWCYISPKHRNEAKNYGDGCPVSRNNHTVIDMTPNCVKIYNQTHTPKLERCQYETDNAKYMFSADNIKSNDSYDSDIYYDAKPAEPMADIYFNTFTMSCDSFHTMSSLYLSTENVFHSIDDIDHLGALDRDRKDQKGLVPNGVIGGISSVLEESRYKKTTTSRKDLLSCKPMRSASFMAYCLSSVVNKQIHLSFIIYLPLIAHLSKCREEDLPIFFGAMAGCELIAKFSVSFMCLRKWVSVCILHVLVSMATLAWCLVLLFYNGFWAVVLVSAGVGACMGASGAYEPTLLMELFSPEILSHSYGLLILLSGVFSLVMFPVQGWTIDSTKGLHLLAMVMSSVALFSALLSTFTSMRCSKLPPPSSPRRRPHQIS